MRIGSTVYVRYKDHSLFRNVEAKFQLPVIQEAFGLLDYEGDDYIRLILSRYQEPTTNGRSVLTKTTGLVIVRSTILEMRRIG